MTDKRIPIILHTDIGSDIDDTWALAMLLIQPQLKPLMVLTDTGNVRYRSTICTKLLQNAGRTEVEVCSGQVMAIIVLFDCRVFGFGKCEELVIPWDKISCFGEDAVLVSIGPEIYERLKCEGKSKKK